MYNNARARAPGLYDPIVTGQADDTWSGVAHHPQDDGVIIESGFNAAEARQTTPHGGLSGDSVAGQSTNREAPRQHPRECITQGNRCSLSPAPSVNGESSSLRAFVTEPHATSAASLYPGLFTIPTASGQQPVQRPPAHSNAIWAAPVSGPASGGDSRFQSTNVSRGMLAQHELPMIHQLRDSKKAIGASEVPPGNGIFASVMTGDRQHPTWSDDGLEGPADPQKEGQAAVDAQDTHHYATPSDQYTADDANNIQYMGREPDPVAQQMEYYLSMAQETFRAFDAGEADPIQVRDVRRVQEVWARHSRESGRQVVAAAERCVFGREFDADRGYAPEDGAVRLYAALQASVQTRRQAQLEAERQYAYEQVRIVREGQARQGTPRMDGRIFAQVMGAQDAAQGGTCPAGASRQEPSLFGDHTGTRGYGPFDGAFFYENPPIPFYRSDQSPSQTAHWRSGRPSPEVPAHAGGSETSSAREHAAYYQGGGYDRSCEPQTGVTHRYHSDAPAAQDGRSGQPVDHRSADIAEWVDAQSARMQVSGGAHVERLSDSGSEAFDGGNGETPSNRNCEEQRGDDGESLGAVGQGPQTCEYGEDEYGEDECGEDWESVTFIGDSEAEYVEVDDGSSDGQ